MAKEDLWKRFVSHTGYTDAETAVFASDPLKVKAVGQCHDIVLDKTRDPQGGLRGAREGQSRGPARVRG